MTVFLAILIVLIIASLQVRFFQQTRTGAARLRHLFPAPGQFMAGVVQVQAPSDAGETTSLERASANDSTPRGVQLTWAEDASPGFLEILDGINQYLRRNANMPVTFLVLQDIVERTTEEHEQTASAAVTLPLYMGLMGTFLGIIVGLVSLASGPSASMEDNDLRQFLIGVLTAMVGSLLGLALYVLGRRALAHSQKQAQVRKRDFLIFLQSELLPAAGKEVATALYDLSANLTRFNQDFSNNLMSFGTAMDAPANALKQQRELLQALENTDLKRIIEANASTMKAIKTASPLLEEWLAATRRFGDELHHTVEIATQLNRLMDRMSTFEDSLNGLASRLQVDQFTANSVVDLIRAQLDTLQNRGRMIQQYVDSQDGAIKQSLREQQVQVTGLIENANQEISSAGREISRSIVAAIGGDKADELVAHIALLRDIAQRTAQSQKSLDSLASRTDGARQEELLKQILQELHTQGQRTLVPQFMHRMFSSGGKGSGQPDGR